MAKEELSVASSEPVSLDEVEEKNTSAHTTQPTALKTDEVASDKVQKEAKSPNKAHDDDLEDIDVDEGSGSKSTSATKATSGAEKDESESLQTAEKSAPQPKSHTDSGLNSDKKVNLVSEAEAPPRPTRPVSPMDQIKRDLKDAFPQTEDKYIEACLIASEGRIDPAFNALLYLLDPSFKPEPVVPAEKQVAKDGKPMYTDDELLARQLQKEFDREEQRRRSAAAKSRLKPHPALPDEEDESPDEIDQLKEQFSQGFEEAKTTINGWVSGLTKKFTQDGESGSSSAGLNLSTKLFGALGGSSFNSANKNRTRKFDDDPEILSLDFSRRVDLKESDPPKLPTRTDRKEQEKRWQPLNSDVPVSSDAFLVDLEDEDKDKK